MKIVLVTGSAGLIGSESVRFFCDRGYTVSETKLHGFLSYLMKCTMTGNPYQLFG